MKAYSVEFSGVLKFTDEEMNAGEQPWQTLLRILGPVGVADAEVLSVFARDEGERWAPDLTAPRSEMNLSVLLTDFESYIHRNDPDSPILQQVWGYLNSLTSRETA